MATRTHTYEVQKGDNVLPEHVGTEVGITEYTTVAEAVANGHYENETAVVMAANAMRRIAANRVVRKELAKKDGTVAKAIELANAVKLAEPKERGTGEGRKQGSGEIKAAKATHSKVETAIRNNLDNARKLKTLVEMEIVTEEQIAQVRAKVEAEKAATPATETK
jgi:hypothetical protein